MLRFENIDFVQLLLLLYIRAILLAFINNFIFSYYRALDLFGLFVCLVTHGELLVVIYYPSYYALPVKF